MSSLWKRDTNALLRDELAGLGRMLGETVAVGVGESIQASDVKLPLDTMKLLSDPDAVVATITVQAEEKTGEEDELEAVEGAEPEVIAEKKEEEPKED